MVHQVGFSLRKHVNIVGVTWLNRGCHVSVYLSRNETHYQLTALCCGSICFVSWNKCRRGED